ncbi:MAG: hypothetical protein ACEQR7_10625 [Agathobacter rectalis]
MVRITDNTLHVGSDIAQKASIFLRTAAERIVIESTPNTPLKTSRLRNDILKQALGLNAKITWSKKYAAFQEEKQYAHYTTAGTGPHYALNAVKKIVADTMSIARSVGLI